MTNRPPCQQVTRRGRPCRNPALPDSDLPRCARHRHWPDAARQLALPGLPPAPPAPPAARPAPAAQRPVPDAPDAHQLRLPGYWAWELAELQLDGLSPNLNQELQQVRVAILRLLWLWDNPAQPLAPEEARRLATLVFSGARTVAYLLGQQTKEGDGQDWLAAALDELGEKYGVKL